MTRAIKYTEEELIALLKQKNKSAFEYLYDNYSGTLYGIITKIVNDEELAQDVLQEAFVKIWRNMEKYEASKSRLFTWMLNIARNHAIDTLRSKKYKYEIQNKGENVDIAEISGSVKTNTDVIGVKQAAASVLDEDQQRVINAVYFMGLTQEEAAKELEMPLGTVKTKIKIALRELRKIFK